jgi:P pilus assembly chaperone PapD
MNKPVLFKMTAALGLLLQGIHAWAGDPQISIGGLYDYMPGKISSITKPIRNNGDETGFLRVEIKRIEFDAQGKSHEVAQADDGAMQDRLIVSPNRLIVPPQGARSTRILYVGKRDAEQYFRVRYLPVEPSRKQGFDVSADTEKKFASAGVKVLIGYGEIVFVRPAKEKYDTAFNPHPSGLTIANNGNSTIVLDNYRVCHAGKSKCEEPSKKFVLPGRKFDVSEPNLAGLDFDLIEGDRTRNQHFDFPAYGR